MKRTGKIFAVIVGVMLILLAIIILAENYVPDRQDVNDETAEVDLSEGFDNASEIGSASENETVIDENVSDEREDDKDSIKLLEKIFDGVCTVYRAHDSSDEQIIVAVMPDGEQVVINTKFSGYEFYMDFLDVNCDGEEDVVLICKRYTDWEKKCKLYFIVHENNKYVTYSCEDFYELVEGGTDFYYDDDIDRLIITDRATDKKFECFVDNKYYSNDGKWLQCDEIEDVNYCADFEVISYRNIIGVYPIVDFAKKSDSNIGLYYQISLQDGKLSVELEYVGNFSIHSDNSHGSPYLFGSGACDTYLYSEYDGFDYNAEIKKYSDIYGLSEDELIESHVIDTIYFTYMIDLYYNDRAGQYFVVIRGGSYHGFVFSRIKMINEEFADDDEFAREVVPQPYVFLSTRGETGADKVGDYKEEKEYDENGNLIRYESRGIIYGWGEEREEFVLKNEYNYNDDNILISWHQAQNSHLWSTTNSSRYFYCDDSGKLQFMSSYVTHGSYDYFYIYEGGDKPRYIVMYDHFYTWVEMYPYPETEELMGDEQTAFEEFFSGTRCAYRYDNSVFRVSDINWDDEDWNAYRIGPLSDVDNDGVSEQIIEGPMGGFYLDFKSGELYRFPQEECIGEMSYIWRDDGCWIKYCDTIHTGRYYYRLIKMDGQEIEEEVCLLASISEDQVWHYYLDGEEVSEEEYNKKKEEIIQN